MGRVYRHMPQFATICYTQLHYLTSPVACAYYCSEMTLAPTGTDAIELVLSRMPLWERTPQKREYLLLRAFDYNPYEACAKVGIRPSTVSRWVTDDEQFKLWDTVEIHRLRRQVVTEVVEGLLMRNLHQALEFDGKLLNKANEIGLDKLTKDEKSYLGRIRGLYTAESLLSIARYKAGTGADDGKGKSGPGDLVIHVNGEQLNSILAQQAGARALLDKFTHKGAVIDNDTGRIVE